RNASELIRLARILRILADGFRHAHHGRSRLFETGRLGLDPLTQAAVAARDLLGTQLNLRAGGADVRHDPGKLVGQGLLLGNVRSVLHDFDRPAARIHDRVVSRLQPDLARPFGETLVDAGIVATLSELVPEAVILLRLRVAGLDEDAVMLTADLF